MNTQSNKTTLTAPDIVCGGCANAIKNAFGRVAGVSEVEVDVATKQQPVTNILVWFLCIGDDVRGFKRGRD